MGMSSLYGPPKPEADMISLTRHAIDSGITFLDSSDVYGPFTNELLLGKDTGTFGINGDPAYVRAACEVTVGEMKKLVEEGKVKYLGLSEASASTIRRAHAIHPISAVQLELSLWSRDAEKDIILTCRELGIGIVVYSPLGRGFFSAGAKILESATERDFRKIAQPRMQGVNLEKNQILFQALQELALRKGCTPGQLALAWVQHQGDDVVPIPGMTRVKNLEENVGALNVKLSQAELEEILALFHEDAIAGERYEDAHLLLSHQNSETPPLSTWTTP